MGKENNLRIKSIVKNPYAITSVALSALSVLAYFMRGVLDRTFLLSPDANRVNLIIVAAIATIAAIASVAAIVKVAGRWRGVFILSLLLCLSITVLALLGASFIGSIG